MRVVLIGAAAVLVAASACSGDDDSTASGGRAGKGGRSNGDASAGTAGDAGAAGSVGFGGSAGSAGSAGLSGSGGLGGSGGTTGGSAGTGGATDGGPCPGPNAIPPETFPLCPDNIRCVPLAGSSDAGTAPDAGDAGGNRICVSARCVPSSAVPDPNQLALLPDCPDPNTKCVPDNFVATVGKFLLKECRSLLDAEGRCIPVSLPAVRAQVDRLPQGVCEATERCAPCYDPLTGQPTGACSAGCGPGADEPAKTYPACCNGLGACIPPALAGADASRLGKESCADANALCAPKSFSDAAYVPPTCRSVGDTEGRCLPDCLPEIAAQASLLPRSTCAEHHLCAPCYDPVKSTASAPVNTGACNRGTDMPKEQPKVFPNCCGDIGVCVPKAAVPAAQQSQLGADTCTGTDILCAPRFLTDPAAKPTKCRSLNDSEGRCLPACLPAVASQPGLPKSTCSDGYLCAPCYNPVTAASSGACGINGDAPTEQPKTFARCCTGDSGACVPTSLIPDAQESLLGKDKCTGANDLCVPTELSDSTFVPPTCNSLGGGEGRCLAPCIPKIAAQASRLPQSTCPANRLCAPCYDPTNGTDTGACKIGTDSPKRPPYTFPKCCAYQGTDRGTCVPSSIVPPQGANLAQGSCPANSGDPFKCVPNLKVADINAKFPTCTAQVPPFDPVPAACVPDCMITDPVQLLILQQKTCAAGELCAPCVNPLDGTRTGACD